MFLRYLYGDVSTIIRIQIKPEIHSYRYRDIYEGISTVTHVPVHMKLEISTSWKSLHSYLQSYMKYFHKLITYYIIDYNHHNIINNVQRQVVGYIMPMKRKRRTILKSPYQERNVYQLMFNNVLPSNSDLLHINTHKGCSLLNANEYNHKLRSVIGREHVSEVTKWT